MYSHSLDNGIYDLVVDLVDRVVGKIPNYYAQYESEIGVRRLLVSCGKLLHPTDDCVRNGQSCLTEKVKYFSCGKG